MTPRRTELDCGATVVSEAMAGVRSVALGLYFPTGSRHATPDNNGISHFIEHLVFKGTRRRTADEINREIDLLGGASNAYTSKETICLHARVLGEHLPRIVEFFSDMATDALPPGLEEEIERERAVILSEISAVEDSPEELVGDLCDEAFFGAHPLGLPVVGTTRAVERLRMREIRSHYQRHLVSGSMVVAAAGSVDHDALVALAREHLGGVQRGAERAVLEPPRPGPATRILERDHEQVHVCLCAPGVARGNPRYRAQEVLSAIVGDGYSSRLFREVRDRRGLAYSVYSGCAGYLDCGSFNVYLGVAPERLAESLEVVRAVLTEVRDGGIDSQELDAAKTHLRGSMILAHESPGARVGFLAEQALLRAGDLEFDAELAGFERVTLGDVRELAAEILAQPLAIAAVGAVPPGVLPEGGLRLPA